MKRFFLILLLSGCQITDSRYEQKEIMDRLNAHAQMLNRHEESMRAMMTAVNAYAMAPTMDRELKALAKKKAEENKKEDKE